MHTQLTLLKENTKYTRPQNRFYFISCNIQQTTFAAVVTRFLFLTGAADAADVNAFMNPALSMATADDNNKKKY